MSDGISRRSFFKIVSSGIAALALVRMDGDFPKELLPEPPLPVVSSRRETIEVFLENDGWSKTWFRFPVLPMMSFEQKENSYIEVFVNKLEILSTPCVLMNYDGIVQLPMSIKLQDGDYLVAYLITEVTNENYY